MSNTQKKSGLTVTDFISKIIALREKLARKKYGYFAASCKTLAATFKHCFGLVCLVLCFSFLITGGAKPALSMESGRLEAIDGFIQSEMQILDIPGLSLGIVEGDDVVHLRGYGTADPSQRQVTPQTPFYINSLTKSFTAIAVMQLVEAGKIDLNASVQQYLPWFQTNDPQASAQITIKDLLYQTSGFPVATGLKTFYEQDVNLEQNVRRLQDTTLSKPVGDTFEYSNINYDILGLLVQTLTGQPFEEYVQEQILTPLEMQDSLLLPKQAQELATGYIPFFGLTVPYQAPRSGSVQPSGGIISTAEDMTHYLITLLNDGNYKNSTLLPLETVTELYQPGVKISEDSDESYAMGWYVISPSSSGKQEIYHPGGSAGFYSYMRLIPEQDLGIVLMMNTQDVLVNQSNNQIGEGIMQLLLGKSLTTSKIPPITWFIRPALIGIVLFQIFRAFRTLKKMKLWQQQSQKNSFLSRQIIRHSILALIIDAVILTFVFIVPWLQVKVPFMFLIRAVPEIAILVMLIALLTIGWGGIRTVLLYKSLRSHNSEATSSR